MLSASTAKKKDDATEITEQLNQTTLSNTDEIVLGALKASINAAPTPHNTPAKNSDDKTPEVPVLRARSGSTDNKKDNLDITTQRTPEKNSVAPTPANSPVATADEISVGQVPPLRVRASSTGSSSSRPNLSPNSMSAGQLVSQSNLFEPVSPSKLPSSLSPHAADTTTITVDSPSGTESIVKRLNF